MATSTPIEPVELAVTTLELALEDSSTAVRTEAVAALGQFGPAAATVAPKLIALSRMGDESLRCQVAKTLGEVGGDVQATVAALINLLGDANPEVKAIAARALGALKTHGRAGGSRDRLRSYRTVTSPCARPPRRPSRRSDRSTRLRRKSWLKGWPVRTPS